MSPEARWSRHVFGKSVLATCIKRSEHPFMLELASWLITSGEAAMLTAAHDSSIRQAGTQRWLHKLSSRRHRRQLFGTLKTINGLRAVGVGSIRAFAEAVEYRLSCTAVQALLRAGGCLRLNFERTAFGLCSRDTHGWKLWRCLFNALGTYQLSLHDAVATR